MSAAEMYHELCAVYSQNISEETVSQWYRMFRDRGTNVHDESSGLPSVLSEDVVQSVDQKISER
jgi:transposase